MLSAAVHPRDAQGWAAAAVLQSPAAVSSGLLWDGPRGVWTATAPGAWARWEVWAVTLARPRQRQGQGQALQRVQVGWVRALPLQVRRRLHLVLQLWWRQQRRRLLPLLRLLLLPLLLHRGPPVQALLALALVAPTPLLQGEVLQFRCLRIRSWQLWQRRRRQQRAWPRAGAHLLLLHPLLPPLPRCLSLGLVSGSQGQTHPTMAAYRPSPRLRGRRVRWWPASCQV